MATKKNQGFDLANLKPTSDTVIVELKHPTEGDVLTKDDGKPMTITLYAPHSKEHKKVFNEQANKRIQLAQKNKGKANLTIEDANRIEIEMLAKTTVSWELQFNGKPLDFSVEAAKELYEEYFWIKDQVVEAQNNLENFIKS